MRDAIRHFTAEFIGVFALVFVGSGSIMMARHTNAGTPLILVATAHALILGVMVSATMRVSGHLNPAVTIGLLVTRRVDPMMAAIYICAQLLGAVAAAYALKATVPPELFSAVRGGGQSVALDVTTGQAIVLELIATFFLTFVVFGTALDQAAPKLGGLMIGLTVGADILAIGPLTGGSMNPARSFGPALASGITEGQLVYWVGPILGSVIAAVIYDQLFLKRAPDAPTPVAVKADDATREPIPPRARKKT
jgi:MIP family channel proteins